MAKQRQVRFAMVMTAEMKAKLLKIAEKDDISAADFVRAAIEEKFQEESQVPDKFPWHGNT